VWHSDAPSGTLNSKEEMKSIPRVPGRQYFEIEKDIEGIEDVLIDLLTLVRQDKIAFAMTYTSKMQAYVKGLRRKLTKEIERNRKEEGNG
jgi:hypothetical protein